MNPLLIRHLYGSARRNRFFLLLTLYLVGVGLLTLLFASVTFSAPYLSSARRISMFELFSTGRFLYQFSGVLLLLTAWLLAPINALGTIAGEREQRTLALLRTTTLPTRSIVLGKLGAALLNGALYIFAPLPLLMFGFWLGGVTTGELVVTVLYLMVTLIASTALALFISSLTRRTIAAVIIFYGLAFATLPLIGIAVPLLSGLASFLVFNPDVPPRPFIVEALAQHGWVLLSSLHPLTAAIASEALWMDKESWFLLEFDVMTRRSITLPSPWIPYTILSLLMSALLLWLAVRRVASHEG